MLWLTRAVLAVLHFAEENKVARSSFKISLTVNHPEKFFGRWHGEAFNAQCGPEEAPKVSSRTSEEMVVSQQMVLEPIKGRHLAALFNGIWKKVVGH